MKSTLIYLLLLVSFSAIGQERNIKQEVIKSMNVELKTNLQYPVATVKAELTGKRVVTTRKKIFGSLLTLIENTQYFTVTLNVKLKSKRQIKYLCTVVYYGDHSNEYSILGCDEEIYGLSLSSILTNNSNLNYVVPLP